MYDKYSQLPTPFLVHKFRFKGSKSARTFLKEIIRIENEEKVEVLVG